MRNVPEKTTNSTAQKCAAATRVKLKELLSSSWGVWVLDFLLGGVFFISFPFLCLLDLDMFSLILCLYLCNLDYKCFAMYFS